MNLQNEEPEGLEKADLFYTFKLKISKASGNWIFTVGAGKEKKEHNDIVLNYHNSPQVLKCLKKIYL